MPEEPACLPHDLRRAGGRQGFRVDGSAVVPRGPVERLDHGQVRGRLGRRVAYRAVAEHAVGEVLDHQAILVDPGDLVTHLGLAATVQGDGYVARPGKEGRGHGEAAVRSRHLIRLAPLQGEGTVELGEHAAFEAQGARHLRVDAARAPRGPGLHRHRLRARHACGSG